MDTIININDKYKGWQKKKNIYIYIYIKKKKKKKKKKKIIINNL